MCNKCNQDYCVRCDGNKKKPHKHAVFIKAWADGFEIQYYDHFYNDWKEAKTPMWGENTAYRIKPEVKPDIVTIQLHYKGCMDPTVYRLVGKERPSGREQKVKWTMDGETGRIKSVELLDV